MLPMEESIRLLTGHVWSATTQNDQLPAQVRDDRKLSMERNGNELQVRDEFEMTVNQHCLLQSRTSRINIVAAATHVA